MFSFYFFVFSFVCFIFLISAERDFYKILNVKRTATSAEIKRAYRKLSLKYHPDKNSAPDAAQKFAEIAAAYDVLSDEEKRKAYNAGGEEAVKQQEQRANTPHADPFDLFQHFGFGGGFRNKEEPRTPNVEVPIRLTLEQLYNGDTLEIEYTRQIICLESKQCEKKNNECSGPGIKIRMQQLAPGFVQQVQINDPTCVAKGKSWKPNCKACPNGMTEEEEILLTVEINRGMENNNIIKYNDIGDEQIGFLSGDLIVKIVELPHEQLIREQNNLKLNLSITLEEALLGFSKNFKHLDGHNVVISSNKISPHGTILHIKGEGMPILNTKNFGDLYVTLLVQFPSELNEKQKKLIQDVNFTY